MQVNNLLLLFILPLTSLACKSQPSSNTTSNRPTPFILRTALWVVNIMHKKGNKQKKRNKKSSEVCSHTTCSNLATWSYLYN